VTKWTASDIPDQSQRTFLITGANSGLGLHSALALVARGARVLMACRSPERGEAAVAEVTQAGDGTAELIVLDLTDLTSVRQAAQQARERTGDRLDVLINNAGVMATPLRRTADGFEWQLAANHLGHAALTWLLMPALRGRPGARVVSVSSLMHQRGGLDLTDLNFERRGYKPWAAYSQSKIANLLFAFELDRRARAAGLDLLSVAAHPGYSHTELTTNMVRARGSERIAEIFGLLGGLFAQPAQAGALPQLYAATAPGVTGGEFYGPDGFRALRGHPKPVRASKQAYDPGSAARFWQLTADLTKIKPDPA
jgi:NAD(P)-dependent dehydrogenase (short-subunit alcohol dehydrogenase family)